MVGWRRSPSPLAGFTVPDEWEGLFDAQSGFLVVEPALHVMAKLAQQAGVMLHQQEPVRDWRVDGEGVVVQTDRASYQAERLILPPGPWSAHLLADLALPLTVLRKVLWWLDIADPNRFQPERFSVFGVSDGPSFVYGLPTFGHPGVKLGEHMGGQVVDPDTVDRTVRDAELAEVLPLAQQTLRGVTGRALDRLVCLYTIVPDEDFVIDRHPHWPQVVFAAGFSGHGFKFAPAIGEHLVALALDAATPYPPFAASRFAALPA